MEKTRREITEKQMIAYINKQSDDRPLEYRMVQGVDEEDNIVGDHMIHIGRSLLKRRIVTQGYTFIKDDRGFEVLFPVSNIYVVNEAMNVNHSVKSKMTYKHLKKIIKKLY